MSERIIDLVNDDDMFSIEMHGLGIFHEEVIRCRDCRKSDPEAYDYCEFCYAQRRDPNGFCAWAERRKND